MAPLKFMCISDTHLGEQASLLNHKEGLDAFGNYLGEIAPDGVENLILAGDITDQVLAATHEFSQATKAFVGMLSSIFGSNLNKIIFLFGNHDLNLFRDNICHGQSNSKFFVHGLNSEGNPDAAKIRKMLVPKSAKDVEFEIANPIYVSQSKNRFYIFHHGHHLRKDIHKGWWFWKLGAMSGIVQEITKNDIDFGEPAPYKADTLEEFESSTFPFVTTLWKNEQDAAQPPEDRFWRYLHKITKHFKNRSVKKGVRRVSPSKMGKIDSFGSELILQQYLPAIDRSGMVALPRKKDITFVYGDTHRGGYEEGKFNGRNVRIQNVGAWITYDGNYHPRCLVYTAGADDKEDMYECGFDKKLIKKAAKPMEKVKKMKLSYLEREFLEHVWDVEL
jgi:predicted phosphodiesterase